MEHFKRKWKTDILEPGAAALYERWARMIRLDHASEFDDFDVFYAWAKSAGYEKGVRLKRYAPGCAYSPENCYFDSAELRAIIDRYDETVAKIRRACGLPPLEMEVSHV